ncbi:MAG: YihY/virulence factor BrkB family protein [Nitriliruptorales bacterium]
MHPLVDRIANRLPRPVDSVWRVAANTTIDTFEDRVPGLAAEAAFFALLSLPPLLLAVLGVVTYLPIEPAQAEETVIGLLSPFLTTRTINDVVTPLVAAILGGEGRADILSLGAVIALWSGSRATSTYITTITIAYDLDDPRKPWERRILAFVVTVVGALVAMLLLPAIIIGPGLLDVLLPEPVRTVVVQAVGLLYWPAVALIAMALLATLYHVGVPWKTPWLRDLPGAVLAVCLLFAGSFGLRVYALLSFGEGATYGGFAAPLVLLLWMYVAALAVLLGAELNAEIEKLWPHEETPEEVAAAHAREE